MKSVFYHHPTEIRVETSSDAVTCNTSCPLIDPQKTVYSWFYNRDAVTYNKKSQFTVTDSGDLFSCSIKGHEDVVSPEVCEYEPINKLYHLFKLVESLMS